MEIRRIILPRTFWDDHSERCPPDPEAGTWHEDVKVSARTVVVDINRKAFNNLADDAGYYSGRDCPDWEDGKAIRRSAKRTSEVLRGVAW